MCGIVAAFELKSKSSELRSQILEMSKRVRHRGPDWSGIYCNDRAILAHERLSIVDPFSGGQPLRSKDNKLYLTVNGEIYNHQTIRSEMKDEYEFLTQSDCEVILALYRKKGVDFLEDMNGIFAFALYDVEKDCYLIARDHIGIIPLYTGWDTFGNYFVASELKALEGVCNKIEEFKPGHYLYSKEGEVKRWYVRDWKEYNSVKNNKTDIQLLRKSLEKAIHRQLMSDVPYGVLLSGGLDSSIIAAIAKKYAARRIETNDMKEAWWPQLHSFAIGLESSPG